eukprot:jgi/Chlat1/7680/Chrsp64S07175
MLCMRPITSSAAVVGAGPSTSYQSCGPCAAYRKVIDNLGYDTLTFLAATVLVVPVFKALNVSPVLGFLLSGFALNQLGVFRNVKDIEELSELGILFLLFEMGLELSLERLKALAKYAFGLGVLQILACTLIFTLFESPPNAAIGTQILQLLFHATPDLVNIRTIDEAVVIGAALSLSSSAFVLQLLSERGELATRVGSATLGILLMQDIAVVPLLVILPLIEAGPSGASAGGGLMFYKLATTALRALGGLGALLLAGRFGLRRLFEVVANSRSSETFVALVLLTVVGTSILTKQLGFSDTLGAFLAGAILAETNFRTQIEADIRPFRGLLLGLFFVTVGTSIDAQLFIKEWPNIFALLAGLLAIKTATISALGPVFGLSRAESVRTGLLLSQGGEFAFVVFSLANRLDVLPEELNRLLIIVVVLSMALTPTLSDVGRWLARRIEDWEATLPPQPGMPAPSSDWTNPMQHCVQEPIVICGFGRLGQVLANFLSSPLVAKGGDASALPYVAFDLQTRRVQAARRLGFPVYYGDGSRADVLRTVGIKRPKAIMVIYTSRRRAVDAVENLRASFPSVPIYARAGDLSHLLELRDAGATEVVLETVETSLQMGTLLLENEGILSYDVAFLREALRQSMEIRARQHAETETERTSADDMQMYASNQITAIADKLAVSPRPSDTVALASMLVSRASRANRPISAADLKQLPNAMGTALVASAAMNGAEQQASQKDDTSKHLPEQQDNGAHQTNQQPRESSTPPKVDHGYRYDSSEDERGVNFCNLNEGEQDDWLVEGEEIDENMVAGRG